MLAGLANGLWALAARLSTSRKAAVSVLEGLANGFYDLAASTILLNTFPSFNYLYYKLIRTQRQLAMKKAGSFFSAMVSKGKKMMNQEKKNQLSPSDKNNDNGFDSGEDDDLIEIGKHKGAGAKSLFQNLESLTGT